MKTRPGLAREENKANRTPMHLAVFWDKINVLRVLLEHDPSLGYVVSSEKEDIPLINFAAHEGNVSAARELLKHCPDAPYRDASGFTCLHHAICSMTEQTEFVEFVLGSPQLRKLVNMRDSDGETPLHLAVRMCNPKIVAALLRHNKDIDVTMLHNTGEPAFSRLVHEADEDAKTLNWVHIFNQKRTILLTSHIHFVRLTT
jgi:ankyrin repeat protein